MNDFREVVSKSASRDVVRKEIVRYVEKPCGI
jgi:hypothetical protein